MLESIKEIITYMINHPLYGCAVIFGLVCWLFYRKIIGIMGEIWVKVELMFLKKSDYKILNDIMIEVGGLTHQIDHLVISKFGIFVIETKNYSGKIYGSEHSEKWTQRLGKQKYAFHSPIRQNYGHISSLMAFLNIQENKFISIVAFANDAKLKVNGKVHVVNFCDLRETIKKYRVELFKDEDVIDIFLNISNANIKNRKMRREHVRNIKKDLKEKCNHDTN